MGLINSINISSGGVPKKPVESAMILFGNVDGDSQNNQNHGGFKRAVCLYSLDLIKKLNSIKHHPVKCLVKNHP